MKPISSALLALALTVSFACTENRTSPDSPITNSSNSVAAFLQNAERQSETDDQRREIQNALRDMLNKSPADLRKIRYADYEGKPNAWSITELLERYFVPNPPSVLNKERFFEEVREPIARIAIERQLDEVSRSLK